MVYFKDKKITTLVVYYGATQRTFCLKLKEIKKFTPKKISYISGTGTS